MVLLWIHRLLTIGGWWFFYDGGPPEPQKGRTPKGRTPKAEPQKPAKRAKNGQKRANRPNYPPEKIQAPPTTDKGERWADSSDVATRARKGGAARAESGRTERPNYGARDDTN